MYWKQSYKILFNIDICKEWMLMFAVSRQFPILNGSITCKQFPLKLTAASTVHGCQDSIYNKICIGIDITDSQWLLKSTNLTQIF